MPIIAPRDTNSNCFAFVNRQRLAFCTSLQPATQISEDLMDVAVLSAHA